MKATLNFDEGIIKGSLLRDIKEIFTEITKASYEQRKTYDEYYFHPTEVEITLERLEKLRKFDIFTFSDNYITIHTN